MRRARLSSPVGTPNGLRESPALGSDPTPTDPDPLLRPLLAVVAALARSSAVRGYPSQLDDLASDVIDLLRALKLEEGRAERLVGGMTGEEKCRAKVRVIKALKTLLEEAPRPAMTDDTSAHTVERASGGDSAFAAARPNGASANELDPELIRPRPVADVSNGTLKAAASLEAPGALGLGRPLNGTSLDPPNGDDRTRHDAEQPILRVSTPGGASTTPTRSRDPSTSRAGDAPTSSSTETRRQPVAPRTFARSLFLLTEPDLRVRVQYAGAAALYIARELPLVVSTSSGSAGSAEELSSFWRQLHAGVYGLAIGETSSPTSSARGHGAVDGAQHALHRTRSARSLRSQRSGRSFLDHDDAARSPSSSSRSTPGAADYAALAALVEAVPRVPAAVLEGVPALLALDAKAATRWEVGLAGGAELGGEGGGADPARAQACREVAARGLKAVGRTWGLTELEQLGHEVRPSLFSLVLMCSTDIDSSYRLSRRSRRPSSPHTLSPRTASRLGRRRHRRRSMPRSSSTSSRPTWACRRRRSSTARASRRCSRSRGRTRLPRSRVRLASLTLSSTPRALDTDAPFRIACSLVGATLAVPLVGAAVTLAHQPRRPFALTSRLSRRLDFPSRLVAASDGRRRLAAPAVDPLERRQRRRRRAGLARAVDSIPLRARPEPRRPAGRARRHGDPHADSQREDERGAERREQRRRDGRMGHGRVGDGRVGRWSGLGTRAAQDKQGNAGERARAGWAEEPCGHGRVEPERWRRRRSERRPRGGKGHGGAVSRPFCEIILYAVPLCKSPWPSPSSPCVSLSFASRREEKDGERECTGSRSDKFYTRRSEGDV